MDEREIFSKDSPVVSSWDPKDKRGVTFPKSIYFGGCSWGAAFFVGVYHAMAEVGYFLVNGVYSFAYRLLLCFGSAVAGVSKGDSSNRRLRGMHICTKYCLRNESRYIYH